MTQPPSGIRENLSKLADRGTQARRDTLRRSARPCLLKTSLAVAISIGIADVSAATTPKSKFRLTLNDEISSRISPPDTKGFDGRLAISGLIQSHPDELFVRLEEKYQALPPFTTAEEAIPERYIVEASASEKVLAGVKSFAGNVTQWVPEVRTSVRYDEINQDFNGTDSNGNPLGRDYATVLATINPTFLYETERRKWQLKARYDYERGQYFLDDESRINDHTFDINWTLRLNRGQELSVATLYENTHDQETNNPIVDFDSALESGQLDYNRSRVNLTYRNGTLRDRTRYEAFVFGENSSHDSSNLAFNDYELDRIGVGGSYAWQFRRQMALVAEARYTEFDYDIAYRDNTFYRALVGADMLVGRRIRAIFRIGYAEKTFDQPATASSFGEPVWSGQLEWALRRKTSIKLETGREIYELTSVGNPVDVNRFNVQNWIRTIWEERWNNNLSTSTTYTYRDTAYEGRDNEEGAHQFIVSAAYQLSNHLKFVIEGAYTKSHDDLGEDLSRRTFTFRTDYSL